MKLTYWIADHLSDSACYSVRAKTKRECAVLVEEHNWGTEPMFDKPRKVTVEYSSGFDLVAQALGEGGVE